MRLTLATFFAVTSLPLLVSADVLSLSDLRWSLRNDNGSVVIPAKVPSQAHLDLLDAGIITEPLLGINGAPYRSMYALEPQGTNGVNRLHSALDRQ